MKTTPGSKVYLKLSGEPRQWYTGVFAGFDFTIIRVLDILPGWCRLEAYSDAMNPKARCCAARPCLEGSESRTG